MFSNTSSIILNGGKWRFNLRQCTFTVNSINKAMRSALKDSPPIKRDPLQNNKKSLRVKKQILNILYLKTFFL